MELQMVVMTNTSGTTDSIPRKKCQRIAIIGGGISGLTAAYELSRTSALREQYQVTVYQMGFRLGGKLASSRNPGKAFRNEEHGLHVWFGFYENAFRMAREVISKWQAPADCPIKDVWNVFRPHDQCILGDGERKNKKTWNLHFPRNHELPGSGRVVPAIETQVASGLSFLGIMLLNLIEMLGIDSNKVLSVTGETGVLLGLANRQANEKISSTALIGNYINILQNTRVYQSTKRLILSSLFYMLAAIHGFYHHTFCVLKFSKNGLRQIYYFIDFWFAFCRGMINPKDRVFENWNLDLINDRDFRVWLIENGLELETAQKFKNIEFLYDSTFQYLEGDRERPSFEAGTAARFLIRTLLTYKNSIVYLFNYGAGDSLIAPIYEVLLDQGVKIEFFHRFEKLGLDQEKQKVERLVFLKQAALKNESYQPLITINGMRCWRHEPDWDQLEDGKALQGAGIDFESADAPIPLAKSVELLHGKDFDKVILALPLGAVSPETNFNSPCVDWLESFEPARRAVENISLVPSVAAQIWLNKKLVYHGRSRTAAVATSNPPLSIWTDMTPVLKHEEWCHEVPLSTIYYCGVYRTDLIKKDRRKPAYIASEEQRAKEKMIAQLKQYGSEIDGLREGIRGEHLCVNDEGVDRFDYQYYKLNYQPSDLCDIANVNSSRYRLNASETGLANMVLSSTWVRTSVNSSCVEAAVMSGLYAAKAVGIDDRSIIGGDFLR